MSDLIINDLWFKTGLSLKELNTQLEAEFKSYDRENEWEWIYTYYKGYLLDITRSHRFPAEENFTRVFSLRNMEEYLLEDLVQKLIDISILPIFLGIWQWDEPHIVIKTFE